MLNPQVLELAAWFFAVLQLILALYIIVLNPTHRANWHVGLLFLMIALSNGAIAALSGARSASEALLPTYVIAATTFPFAAGSALVAVLLVKPEWWYSGRWRWLLWVSYVFVVAPILLTLMDAGLGTRLWYTGFDPTTYQGGYIRQAEYVGLARSGLVTGFYGFVLGLAPLALVLWVLRDRKTTPERRRLARYLLIPLIAGIVIQGVLRPVINPVVGPLLYTTLFVIVYGWATFEQMVSERRLQRGRLRVRLTALILATALPLLVAAVLVVGRQARSIIEETAEARLEEWNRALRQSVNLWTGILTSGLSELLTEPGIVTMDPNLQRPYLVQFDKAYAGVYLVSTTDLQGMNVARSDDANLTDYRDRLWFKQARDGAALTFQIVKGRTSGQPALVVSMPIYNASREIVGVGMFAATLADVTRVVGVSKVGATGMAYIVDAEGTAVAHSDPELIQAGDDGQPRNLADDPAVQLLRGEGPGIYRFEDAEGITWWASADVLDSGWGIIVRQQEQELLGAIARFQRVAWGIIVVGAGLLSVLGFVTIRQAVEPIVSLTDTATAIAAGDLGRVAPIESEDEIGTLARAFNTMTAQLNNMIGSLEDRVAERTSQLERRAEYLAVTGSVSQVAASILDPDELLNRVVDLISERFGFYHTGVFVMDDSRQWVMLRAASSEGGRRMLARGHRLRVGQGIVGTVADIGRARIALDVDTDAVWVQNPDLPTTRSEMALPLMVGDQILGVLDVQSEAAEAFTTEDISTLRILADQVAVALQNARQFEMAQRALGTLQEIYGGDVSRAWAGIARSRGGLRYTGTGVEAAEAFADAEGTPGQMVVAEDNTLLVPLRSFGEQVFAVLRLRRDVSRPWLSHEQAFAERTAQVLAQALENARLLEDARRRAAREKLVGEVSGRIRATLDMDLVLQTALREIGRTLELSDIEVRMVSGAKLDTSLG